MKRWIALWRADTSHLLPAPLPDQHEDDACGDVQAPDGAGDAHLHLETRHGWTDRRTDGRQMNGGGGGRRDEDNLFFYHFIFLLPLVAML